MPRSARVLVDGGIYHVMSRGNNRQPVFHAEADYERYLQLLASYALRHNLKVYHFALLPAQVHVVLEVPLSEALSRAMRGLNLAYALFYRRRYQYTGHLWEGRYRSLLIGRERLLAWGRVVELDPVRAGLASGPQAYAWSSYRRYAEGAEHPLLAPHPVYHTLGVTTEDRQEAYRRFMRDGLHERALTVPVGRPGRPSKLQQFGAAMLLWLSCAASAGAVQEAVRVTVTGTVDEPATIVVNGVAATVSGSTFTASNVPLVFGGNTITVVATDAAGNRSTASIAVTVMKRFAIQGTVNEPVTSVVVNGVAAAVSGTTFSASVPLRRGLNTVSATATDTSGNTGTSSMDLFAAYAPVDHP